MSTEESITVDDKPKRRQRSKYSVPREGKEDKVVSKNASSATRSNDTQPDDADDTHSAKRKNKPQKSAAKKANTDAAKKLLSKKPNTDAQLLNPNIRAYAGSNEIINVASTSKNYTFLHSQPVDASTPPRTKKKKAGQVSPQEDLHMKSILNILTKELLLKIFDFMRGRDLCSLLVTCKIFLLSIERNQILSDRIKRTWDEIGTFVKIEAKHSLFFRFETLIEELLVEFPSLVIHCEIDGSAEVGHSRDPDWTSYTLVNSERFDLQSLTPQTRTYEKDRLKERLRMLVTRQSNMFPTHLVPNIKKQSWFLDFDRKEVEKVLGREADFTFCIRNSSVENSFVLSYKNKDVFHSLIVPWKEEWYFSGNMTDDFVVHGLFFTSVAHLVWYWRKMGLGQHWVPLNYH